MEDQKVGALLDSLTLANQANEYGLPAPSFEKLVAMDRVLRSLVVASAQAGQPTEELFGYALSGPTALLFVYSHLGVPWRVPDELTLSPIRKDNLPLSPDDLAKVLAHLLPEGVAEALGADQDPECYKVKFKGVLGPNEFLLRLESTRLVLSMPPPTPARSAAIARPGYVYDARLRFKPNFSQPFALPVALAEEIILRELRVLQLLADYPQRKPTHPHLDDRAFRTDDLRFLATQEYNGIAEALAGPIRQRLSEARSTDFKIWMAGFVSSLTKQIQRHSLPAAIPAEVRPTVLHYDEEGQVDFLNRMAALLTLLEHGRV